MMILNHKALLKEKLKPHAHACSEIDVKWFLSLKHSQNALIRQIHDGPVYAKTELKPFLTVLGTETV